MLFETKDKADKFIKFNADEILEESGRAPVRSYYCTFCCGWHVTSNPSEEIGEKLDQRDKKQIGKLERVKKTEEKAKEASRIVTQEKLQFDYNLHLCNFEKAEEILDLLEYDAAKLKELKPNCASRSLAKVATARTLLNICKKVYDMPKEEQQAFLNIVEPNKEEAIIIKRIHRINAFKNVMAVLNTKEILVSSDNEEMVNQILELCETNIEKSAYGNGAKEARDYLNSLLDEIVKARNKQKLN